MHVTRDKLMQGFATVVGDTEELLKATAAQTGEHIARIRARAEESVRAARVQLKNGATSADATVRENPWVAVGVAAGVGLVLGLLIGRR